MQLKGRQVDPWGIVSFTEQGLYDMIMRGTEIAGVTAVNTVDVNQFNSLCREFDHPDDAVVPYEQPAVPVDQWDAEHQAQWFTPEPFASISVKPWLLERCKTQEEVDRIELEWALFEERQMEPVLRLLIYLIHYFRENNIVWGVGRGSSVSSFALYLIGVHKVNSIAFDLDPHEFLK